MSRKRYRYTGKEKDEETGFSYHHHRYYAPWLGRWGSADPAGLVGGGNQFLYARGRSTRSIDDDGLYEQDVHFYVTGAMVRQLGLSESASLRVAQAAALPDEVSDFDAISAAIDGNPQPGADFHALTGGDPEPVRALAREGIRTALAGGTNVGAKEALLLGLSIHLLGDSYSHLNKEGTRLAPPLVGHFGRGHESDRPEKNQAHYAAYLADLDATLSGALPRPNAAWERFKDTNGSELGLVTQGSKPWADDPSLLADERTKRVVESFAFLEGHETLGASASGLGGFSMAYAWNQVFAPVFGAASPSEKAGNWSQSYDQLPTLDQRLALDPSIDQADLAWALDHLRAPTAP